MSAAGSTSVTHGLWALTNRELKKWYKEPLLVFLAIIQPVIWMGLFGKAMNLGAVFSGSPATVPSNLPPEVQEGVSSVLKGLSGDLMARTFGTTDYFSFMAVGIFSFVVIFTTMFSGMSFVWDRRLGFLNKVLTTPVSRGTIILSKMLSSVIRSLAQVLIVFLVALALGLKFGSSFSPLSLVAVLLALFLMSIGLASIFIMIAIRSTRWETPMAVMNLFNLPLLFASNALFPISMMPGWLQAMAKVNPVTYATDVSRQLILYSADFQRLAVDFIFLSLFAVTFASLGIVLSWKYLTK